LRITKSVVIADITFVIMKIRAVLVTVTLIITISVMCSAWSIGAGIGARRRRRRMSNSYIALCIAFLCGWFCRWLYEGLNKTGGVK
jgi:hypothetical protein